MTRARLLVMTVFCLVLAPALLLSGCGNQPKGFNGQTLFTGSLPFLSITPTPPLETLGSGSLLANVPTDTSIKATTRVDYAVYGDPAETGPVLRHGHVLVASFTGVDKTWYFAPESFPRLNEVYLEIVKINDQDWTEHLLYQISEGDWFSDLWLANKREVPEIWIAKRWSRTYFGETRVVLEYREPMPACVNIVRGSRIINNTSGFIGNSAQCGDYLQDFYRRADQAFEILSSRGQEISPTSSRAETGGKELVRPASRPNMEKLLGTARKNTILDYHDD